MIEHIREVLGWRVNKTQSVHNIRVERWVPPVAEPPPVGLATRPLQPTGTPRKMEPVAAL